MSNVEALKLSMRRRLHKFRKIQILTPFGAKKSPPLWRNWEVSGKVILRKKNTVREIRRLAAENMGKGWRFRLKKWRET